MHTQQPALWCPVSTTRIKQILINITPFPSRGQALSGFSFSRQEHPGICYLFEMVEAWTVLQNSWVARRLSKPSKLPIIKIPSGTQCPRASALKRNFQEKLQSPLWQNQFSDQEKKALAAMVKARGQISVVVFWNDKPEMVEVPGALRNRYQ